MLILHIDLAPSQNSAPHRPRFCLRIRGHYRNAGARLAADSIGLAEMFHETPQDIDQVSGDASDTEPAKVLVHI